MTIVRLRKLLGHDDAAVLQEGKLSLDETRVWTDVAAFERTCRASLLRDRRSVPGRAVDHDRIPRYGAAGASTTAPRPIANCGNAA